MAVACDGCTEPIRTKYMTCTTCGMVDLCNKCYSKKDTIHPQHDTWQRGALVASEKRTERPVASTPRIVGELTAAHLMKESPSPPRKNRTEQQQTMGTAPVFPIGAAAASSTALPTDAIAAMFMNIRANMATKSEMSDIRTNMTTNSDLALFKQDMMQDTRVAIA